MNDTPQRRQALNPHTRKKLAEKAADLALDAANGTAGASEKAYRIRKVLAQDRRMVI